MKSVYLAGPLTGVSYEHAVQWRRDVQTRLEGQARCWSPLAGQYFPGDVPNVDDTDPLGTARGVTARDRYYVQQSHIVLANMLGAQRVSLGTAIEMAWADAYRIPVVLAMEIEGNVNDHGMLRELASFRVDSLDEAIRILEVMV